ncbi:MAG: CBS domain-containing protein [Nitrospirae bacterium]|nr:CBS domain-containing protein [Nitrospirota bacterium]
MEFKTNPTNSSNSFNSTNPTNSSNYKNMSKEIVVENIMVSISKYPHVPYWLSISKTVEIARLSLSEKKRHPGHMAALVFDERYDLMGTISLKDLLKWLIESKASADRPVSEIMKPAKLYVGPSDSISKAADLMLQNDLEILPVIEDSVQLIGLVRMVEVFDNLSNG